MAYEVGGKLPEGPNVVGANISTDSRFTATVTVLGSVGSEVVYGDLQAIPIADSLLWVRPVYVESQSVGQPQVRLMVAYYQGEVGFGESLEAALAQLFPGLEVEIGDVVGGSPEPTNPDDPDEPAVDVTASDLLNEAEQLFQEADEALENKDLATYDEKVKAASRVGCPGARPARLLTCSAPDLHCQMGSRPAGLPAASPFVLRRTCSANAAKSWRKAISYRACSAASFTCEVFRPSNSSSLTADLEVSSVWAARPSRSRPSSLT